MSNLLVQFKNHMQQQFPQIAVQNNMLVLAISGGVDSVVLLHLLAASGYNLELAHCNFQLRAEESERDEAFVQSLAIQYQKKLHLRRFSTAQIAASEKKSIQETARTIRYSWFAELVEENRDTYLVTAHHANDNIETLLMHFFRGTGINGLHGIPPQQNRIIRPLLFAKREDILEYAKVHHLSWVEDSSNALDKYTRNYFRLGLIPSIKEVYPQVEDNLLHNIDRFKEAEILYQQAIDLHKKKLLEYKNAEVHIPILKLLQTVPFNAVVWEIFKPFGFNAQQVNEVRKLCTADNGSSILSTSYRIIRNRNWLIIAPVQNIDNTIIVVERNASKVVYGSGQLTIDHLNKTTSSITSDNDTALLDADKISYPLLLRKWKQGDYFYPLGMQKKKKLSRFFIDQKLSATEKEQVWVLESDKKIIWVVGYRIDDRSKVTNQTKKMIKLQV
ncbi:tRNA lysidine(34) synthetase TilS [Limnovirga soli]|nr:tRNA lysidine(34) synthetase TilS [Limnovirga soli]